MKKVILVVLVMCLSACSRQAFEGEHINPAQTAITESDTAGDSQREHEFKVYWVHKEDSIKQLAPVAWE